MSKFLKLCRKSADRILEDYRIAAARKKADKLSLDKARERRADALEAQGITQSVAAAVQQKVHAHIATVVSKCLATVFDNTYAFQIIFDRKRGKTEARLVFTRGGKEFVPTEDSGGGIVEVAAFALRLACLVLTRPPLRRLLVLDEPFRCVDKQQSARVREMLEVISEEMKIQIVMVTHNPDLGTGKVIRLPIKKRLSIRRRGS